MKKVVLTGNLGKDSKFFPNDNPKHSILTFSVGCREWDRKTKTNVTDWVECILFGERASKDQTLLLKGCWVVVSGRLLRPESWTSKDGKVYVNSKVSVDEWEFVGAKPSADTADTTSNQADDDIPF